MTCVAWIFSLEDQNTCKAVWVVLANKIRIIGLAAISRPETVSSDLKMTKKDNFGNKSLMGLFMYFLTFAVATACVAVGLHKFHVCDAAVTFRRPSWTMKGIFV